MIVMVNQAPPATSRRSRTRLLVQGLLSLVLVVAIFYFLRKKLDPAQMWTAISAMTWPELATLGLLAVWNRCTYAFVWMTVTPGLGFWRAMEMTQATTAVANTVPGGSAIGIGMTYSMLGSWGYSRSRATTAVLVGRRASTRRGDWPMANRSAPPALHPQPQPLPAGRVAAGGEAAAAPLHLGQLPHLHRRLRGADPRRGQAPGAHPGPTQPPLRLPIGPW